MAGKKRQGARRSKKSGGSYERNVFIGIIIALLAVAVLLWAPPAGKKKPAEHAPQASRAKTEDRPAVQEPSSRPAPQQDSKVVRWSSVAIVIDDLGQDAAAAQEILSLPAPVSLSVLPHLPQSRQIAEAAKRKGREVLLHLPMERLDRNGKREAAGTLRSDMTPQEFIDVLTRNLDSVPAAAGVNNHEGSSLTENRQAMMFLMAQLKDRNVYFLDSLTNPRSTAAAVAAEFGLKTAKRDVFLDNDMDNPAAIRAQFEEVEQIAARLGKAVAIGHPHPATLRELKKWLAGIDAKGIRIVPVSSLVK